MEDKFFIPERPTAYEHRTINAQHVPKPGTAGRVAATRRVSAVSNLRMIGLAAATVVVLCLCLGGLLVLVDRREAALHSASAGGCSNETITLDIAHNTGLVVAVDKKGPDVLVTVSWRAWIKSTRKAQIAIAMAAYCHASPAAKGVVRVVDESDKELGLVVAGNWQSRLFPQ